jgi:hypothetical protein
MIGRISIAVVLLVIVLAWMLADPPRQITQAIATPDETAAPTETPKAAPLAMAQISLPPPPAPIPALVPAITPRTVTPMKAAVETTPPASKALQPLAPQPQPPQQPAMQPKRPASTVKSIEPIKPAPKPAQQIAKPQPTPPTTPPRPTPPMPTSQDAAAAGRPLLRLLEHGKGPSVEISWPASASARHQLYRLFKQCYGMRIAVMGADGRLFDDASRPGQPWAVNLDRYSGFVRQSSGRASLDEHNTARRIRNRHDLGMVTTVRLFPRRTDALLLGGLKSLIGAHYKNATRIRAHYLLAGWRVHVAGITVNAQPIAGRIDLSSGTIRRCAI